MCVRHTHFNWIFCIINLFALVFNSFKTNPTQTHTHIVCLVSNTDTRCVKETPFNHFAWKCENCDTKWELINSDSTWYAWFQIILIVFHFSFCLCLFVSHLSI